EARTVTVEQERVGIKRIHPLHYVYDPDVPWAERTWEAELESMRVKDLFEEGGWRNLNLTNVPLEEKQALLVNEAHDDQTVRVWHIHDIDNDKAYSISETGPIGGRFIRKGDWPFGRIPVYYMHKFRPCGAGKTYGLATAKLALPILDELAWVEYHIQRHVNRHANYKTIFPKGTNSRQTKADLADDNQESADASPEVIAGMKEHKPPAIPETLLKRRDQLENDLRRIIGTDAQDQGSDHAHAITATESARRGISADSTTDERQGLIAAMLTWYAETTLALHREFATMTRPIKTEGPEGYGFRDVDPRELPDAFSILLDVQSETDEAKDFKLQRAGLVVNHLRTSMMPVDPAKLDKWYLRQLGEKNYEQFRMEAPAGPQNIEEGQPSQAPQGGGDVLPLEPKQTNFAPSPQTLAGA
ncbi:MAG TPA: hypothetical protein VM243_06850, partial [Phycisphaerae bacterium]|nr:hypothetical protein [Phycisphaerae bacterium]